MIKQRHESKISSQRYGKEEGLVINCIRDAKKRE